MKKVLFFILLSLNFGQDSSAQTIIDTSAIINELTLIHDRDQKTRASGDSSQFIFFIDSCNLVQIETLISKYGWPGKSFVGAKGNNTVWLVIQHADLATQERYLPMMEKSVADNESRSCDLALLQDRILMRQGKKQFYGSQVTFNKITGDQEFWPIEDEANVNSRRTKVGLEPIEEYAKYFDIEYKPRKE